MSELPTLDDLKEFLTDPAIFWPIVVLTLGMLVILGVLGVVLMSIDWTACPKCDYTINRNHYDHTYNPSTDRVDLTCPRCGYDLPLEP